MTDLLKKIAAFLAAAQQAVDTFVPIIEQFIGQLTPATLTAGAVSALPDWLKQLLFGLLQQFLPKLAKA